MNTEIFNDINWLAVIAATFAFFILGALWYSKAMFANKWIELEKIDMNDPNLKKGVALIMITSLVWMFIICVGIALLRARIDTYGLFAGIKIGVLSGLFFGMAAISISYLYEKRPLGLYLINGGYTVVGNIIAAIIICMWT